MPSYATRSGKVRVRVQVDGRQISKTFDNKEDAKLWAISMESGLENQASPINDQRSVKADNIDPKTSVKCCLNMR